MARKDKKNGEAGDSFESGAATPGHNMSNIKQTIASAAAECDSLDSQIKQLQEDKREVRATVKALGVTMREFDMARRYTRFDDDEKRAEAIDWLKVCFEALGVGAQGSLFPDAGATAQQPSA